MKDRNQSYFDKVTKALFPPLEHPTPHLTNAEIAHAIDYIQSQPGWGHTDLGSYSAGAGHSNMGLRPAPPPTPPRDTVSSSVESNTPKQDALRPASRCPKCDSKYGFHWSRCDPIYRQSQDMGNPYGELEWTCHTCGYIILTPTADALT